MPILNAEGLEKIIFWHSFTHICMDTLPFCGFGHRAFCSKLVDVAERGPKNSKDQKIHVSAQLLSKSACSKFDLKISLYLEGHEELHIKAY